MNTIEEELEFLFRSDTRAKLLATLQGEQPLDRYELENRLEPSRRTITRTLNKLEDRNYIHESADGYRLTALGEAEIETYQEYEKRVRLATTYRPVLGNVDAEALDLDVEYLEDAELVVADETTPYAPLDRTLELRAEATRIREMAPAVEKRSIEQLTERVERDDEFTFEVILPVETAKQAASSPAYATAHEVTRTADCVEQYVYSGEFPFFVGVMDETALLGSTVGGDPYAVVESEREELREWAERKIDEFRHQSTPIDRFVD